MLTSWKESYDQPRQHIKKQRHNFANKGPSSQSYGFSGSHVWTWELDYKESWAPKNWCSWTVVLEKTLESPLDCKEVQPVHPKGDQFWVFIGRTDVEAETSMLATGRENISFIPIPKKGNAKESSNYHTIAIISHTSKVMLKILQFFNSTWTVNFQLLKPDLEKAEEPEIKLPTSSGSSKKL